MILLQPNRNVCTGFLPSLSDSELSMPLIWNGKSIVIVQLLPPINWCIHVKHGSKLIVTQGLFFRNRLKPHISHVLTLTSHLEKHSFPSQGTSEQLRRAVCHLVWSWCKLSQARSCEGQWCFVQTPSKGKSTFFLAALHCELCEQNCFPFYKRKKKNPKLYIYSENPKMIKLLFEKPPHSNWKAHATPQQVPRRAPTKAFREQQGPAALKEANWELRAAPTQPRWGTHQQSAVPQRRSWSSRAVASPVDGPVVIGQKQ